MAFPTAGTTSPSCFGGVPSAPVLALASEDAAPSPTVAAPAPAAATHAALSGSPLACASSDASASPVTPEPPAVSPAARTLVRALLAAHESWFDIESPARVAGRTFAGHATYREHGEKYVLSKRAKLWEVDTGEHLLFDAVPRLDAALLADYVSFIKTAALAELVHPAPNHMSTNVGLVLVADTIDEQAAHALRTTRFRKNHRLGLWGWTDLRLAAIDLSRVVSTASAPASATPVVASDSAAAPALASTTPADASAPASSSTSARAATSARPRLFNPRPPRLPRELRAAVITNGAGATLRTTLEANLLVSAPAK